MNDISEMVTVITGASSEIGKACALNSRTEAQL
jgi:NADP-dependent 3-hydroxy acid dehydrogenase YdfG